MSILVLALLIVPVLGQDDTYDWNKKGREYYESGSYDLSLQCYEKAISMIGIYTDSHESALAWNGKGLDLVNVGRPEEAVTSYEKALSYYSNDADIWKNKGDVLCFRLGRCDEALEAYNQATAINPLDAAAWVGKGSILSSLGRYEDALQAYENCIALDPTHAGIWSTRAYALEKLGQYEGALASYDREIENHPSSYSWGLKADALSRMGKYEDALNVYDKAIEIGESKWPFIYAKAKVYELLGKSKEAIDAYNEATARNPSAVGAIVWLDKGTALYNFSKYDEAIISLDNAANTSEASIKDFENESYYRSHGFSETEASEIIDSSTQLNKNAWYYKGLAYQALNCSAEANDAFIKAGTTIGSQETPNVSNQTQAENLTISSGAIENGGVYTIQCIKSGENAGWLVGLPNKGSVALAPTNASLGAKWKIVEAASRVYYLNCLSNEIGPKWLDGEITNSTVILAPTTTDPYLGTRWAISEVNPGIYQFKVLQGYTDGPRWLEGEIDGSVALASISTDLDTGVRWQIVKQNYIPG